MSVSRKVCHISVRRASGCCKSDARKSRQYDDTSKLSSENENWSENATYESFLAIMDQKALITWQMFLPTNWKVSIIHWTKSCTLYGTLEEIISVDKIPSIAFLKRTVLQKGGSWDILAIIFKQKTRKFQLIITRFLYSVGPIIYNFS